MIYLAISSTEMMGLNRPLKHQVICHVTIFPKVVNYRPIGAGLRKEIEQQHFSYSY